jgi:tRNA(Arg) A34 adenosine deaminase TadA/GNAT superfamily N-acetyltransferase
MTQMMKMMTVDKLLVKLAREAAADGDVPVAAVIVDKNGEVVGHGRNRRESKRNALAHAEIEAINEACNALGGWRLCGCEMYVTMAPCPMCAGAIDNARIEKVIVKEELVRGIIDSFFEKLRERKKMFDINFIEVKTESQIKRTAELAGEIWREWFPLVIGLPQTEYMIERFQSFPAMTEQITNSGYIYYILQKNGTDIGYTAIVPKSDGELFLSKAYIKKVFRSNGYFRQLLEFIKEYAKGNGFTHITLTVNKGNELANTVYTKTGFIKTGEGKTDIGGGFYMDDFYYTLYIS